MSVSEAKVPEIIRLHVTVTSRDIEKGMPGSCGFCAVALAIRRAARKLKEASVLADTVLVSGTHAYMDTYLTELPESFRKLVREFDKGASFLGADLPEGELEFVKQNMVGQKGAA